MVWGNTTENFIGTDPAVGDTTWGVNENGVPCDRFFNVVRDPKIAGFLPWEYSLSYGSPCIDAGNPDMPTDPDGTTTDAGAHYFSQLDSISVVLYPHETELEPGQTITYELSISNPGTGTFSGQVWTEIELPGGAMVSPLLGPRDIDFSPDDSTSWLTPQKIPYHAPAGSTYVYTARLDFFPDVTVASDHFFFTVLEGVE